MTLPNGLAFYADSDDVKNADRLLATLARARAKVCLVPCESLPWPDGTVPRPSLGTLAALCDHLRAAGVAPIIYTFPAVDGDLVDSLAHARAAKVACGAPLQLDAEPHGPPASLAHWTPSAYAAWAPFVDSVTTTRWERGHVGAVAVPVWLQAERMGSVAPTLATAQPSDVMVIGSFDRPGQPRSLDDIRADLALVEAHAKATGVLGVWSARTTSPAECDLLAAWATGLGW